MKTTLFICTLFLAQSTFTQNAEEKKPGNDKFYLYYGIAGLGSNFGRFMPTIRIQNHKFTYTKEQNSYWGKRSKKKELISKGAFRQSSIDSILSIIAGLKDSTIYKTNPCIMSGQITSVTIAYGTDTTKFTLDNTTDLTMLKIIDIINPYLPKDKKLYESIEQLKREEECWTSLRQRAKEKADSSKL